MVNAVGTSNINPIQMFSALNAFKSNAIEATEQMMPEISDGLNIQDDFLLKNQNLQEIKDIAKVAGEENISDDDIKYGLTYGRSVIADYIA